MLSGGGGERWPFHHASFSSCRFSVHLPRPEALARAAASEDTSVPDRATSRLMPLTSEDRHGLSQGTDGYGDGRAELDGSGRTPQRRMGF